MTRVVDWFSGLTCRERIHVYALGVMMVGSVAHGLLFSTYYIEDAGITFAYSRNLIEGEGLAPWAGSERVEGYSNPLWTFLIAAWYAIGVPVWTSSKLMGATFGAACLPIVYLVTRRCWPERQDHVPLLPPLFLAASTQWTIWNVSGLENGLFNLLLALGIWRTLEEVEEPGGTPWSALAYFGLAITRPEGILYAAIGGFFRLAGALIDRRGYLDVAKWLALFWGPFALYHAWRYSYFAWEWPNTYYAKLDGENRFKPLNWNGGGWRYIRRYGAATFLGAALPLYGAGLVTLRDKRKWLLVGLTAVVATLLLWDGKAGFDRDMRPEFWSDLLRDWNEYRVWALVAATAALGVATTFHKGALARLLVLCSGAATMFFIVYSGGDWMKQWRWFNMVAMPAFILLGLGLGALTEALPFGERRVRGRRLGGLYVGGIAVAILVPNIWQSLHAAPEPETTVRDIRRRVTYMTWVKNRLHLDFVRLLDVDMGAHMWFTDWAIADIAGLIDVKMSRHLYQKKFIKQYIFQEFVPTFAHVHAGWASKSKINTHVEWKQNYIEVPGYPNGGRSLHVGNHIRKDIFVEKRYAGPPGRDVDYDDGWFLEGWDAPAPIVPVAGKAYLEFWTRTAFKRRDVRALVVLDDGQGHRQVTSLPPGYNWYEVEDWKSHEHVRNRYDFELDADLPEGTYDLGFVFLHGKTGEVILPEDHDPEATVRYMEGEVWFDDAYQITTRTRATKEAQADHDRALELATTDDCEEAWAAWRQARWHVYRNLKWHEDRIDGVRNAVAGCYADRAAGSPDDLDAQVEALKQGRIYDHHNDRVEELGADLAVTLEALGDEHAAEEAWEAAYGAYRDAMIVDPSASFVRRKAEEARDKSLEIEGKVKDKSGGKPRGKPAKTRDDKKDDDDAPSGKDESSEEDEASENGEMSEQDDQPADKGEAPQQEPAEAGPPAGKEQR